MLYGETFPNFSRDLQPTSFWAKDKGSIEVTTCRWRKPSPRDCAFEVMIFGLGAFRENSDFRTFLTFFVQPHRRPDYLATDDNWHDEVDLSQCFQDTAVLYSICVVLWVLAALRFFFYTRRPPLSFTWLSFLKIVRAQ